MLYTHTQNALRTSENPHTLLYRYDSRVAISQPPNATKAKRKKTPQRSGSEKKSIYPLEPLLASAAIH